MRRSNLWLLALALGLTVGCPKPELAASPTPVAPGGEAVRARGRTVVVGIARTYATRDGHLVSIAVDRVLRGRAGFEVAFISEPISLPEGPAVYVLEPEGDAMRLTFVDGKSWLPREEAERLASEPTPAPPPIPTEYEADLAAIRAHDQHAAWTPRASPPKDAAQRVFDEIVWIGRDEGETLRLLGPPMRRSPRGGGELWEYAYHSGEQGIVRWLAVEDGRVTSLFVVRTQ